MNDKSRDWIAPLTGIVAIVLLVVGVLVGVGDAPEAKSDSAREIVAFYQDNEGSQSLFIGLLMIASPLLVVFGATLRTALRAGQQDESGDVMPAVALAGATILAAGFAFDATLTIALVDTAGEVSPQTTQALSALWNNDFLFFASGMSILMLGTAVSVLRHGGLPKWIGVVAAIAVVLTPTPIGFAGFVIGLVLVAVISVLLTLRARSAAATTPAPAA